MGAVVAFKPWENSVHRKVFFTKGDIRKGVRLVNCGRRAKPGESTWEVVKVATYMPRAHRVTFRPDVRTLGDTVMLRNTKTGEIRSMMFSAISYSAIWWLA